MSLNEFEKKFPLDNNVSSELKIIIGEQPYKQALNNVPFSVDGSSSSVLIYKEIGNVSFLVSDWIKIQDSLEMVFNLIFGHKRSLLALAYLRENHIPPIDFADFLWTKARLILLNRYVDDYDFGGKIKLFIEKNTQSGATSHILFVGNESENNFPSLSCVYKSAISIHPSGVNINFKNRRLRYYDNWIDCNNANLVKNNGLSLSSFRVFV